MSTRPRRLGTKHPNATLETDQVADIRAARRRSTEIQLDILALREKFQEDMAVLRTEQQTLSLKALAEKHNTTESVVCDVAAYRSYAFD